MLYPKIMSPFVRHTEGLLRNRLDIGNWAREEFRVLKDLSWEWTEKVDGVNARVLWDGYKVRFGGRTDNAQMSTALLSVLTDMFPEELLEQQFGKSPAVLYGEGYGPRLNKGGGSYRSSPGFVLFDVNVDNYWLLRPNLFDIAHGLGIEHVPAVGLITIAQAIDLVAGGLKSNWGNFLAEGLVGTPPMGLLDRAGEPIKIKVKTKDFQNG